MVRIKQLNGRRTDQSRVSCTAMALLLLVAGGCSPAGESLSAEPDDQSGIEAGRADSTTALDAAVPCAVALTPHVGEASIDGEIRDLQRQAGKTTNTKNALERLGWLFVSKARLSYDPGYYNLAEQSALCLESRVPGNPAALLLRGHVMHNLHRFKEAEELARELVANRGLPFDHGLLGDALMEQGKLSEAVDAYQKMVDLKPDVHAYSRIAHLRWLKGDLEGAVALMEMAARGSSPRSPEAAAWAYTRLGLYEFQMGASERALRACRVALEFVQDYAPALLAQGRILLARGQLSTAIELLRRAAELNPLPEYQWLLADALQTAGRSKEAYRIEGRLTEEGVHSDPRTLSLYLATRGEDVETAFRLAQRELESREDIFTLDALAWSLRANGKTDQARSVIRRALAEGTPEARLFFHAAVISAEAGDSQEAARWSKKAHSIQQMLLPSERRQLADATWAQTGIPPTHDASVQ